MGPFRESPGSRSGGVRPADPWPGLGVVDGAPRTPLWTVILGPAFLLNPAQKRAEFLRIFGTCGATSRGGGGAPPTTLILLRNQWAESTLRRAPRTRGAGP